MKRVLAFTLCISIIIACFVACSKKPDSDETSKVITTSSQPAESEENKTDDTTAKKVKVTMDGGGEFVIELYPEYAPQTVENFISLVNDGFYNGITFHRVIKGFMAQAGDPTGSGSGGSKKNIKGEFADNGFEQNTLSHTRGVISMARMPTDPDSASSQFFICYSDEYASALDGQYAAFGKVVEGMDVVDELAEHEMTRNSSGELASPVDPIYIKTMEVM